VYGFVSGDDLLRFTGILINEVLDELGTPNDFLGHAGGDNFILVTAEEKAEAIRTRLKTRYAEEVQIHYNFTDREKGYIQATDESGQTTQIPLVNLAVGIVTPSEYQFADIREITELAADARRQDVL
jgi:GGDEF domain-containing protein